MLKAVGDTWRQFALQSSMHGLKYAVGRRRIDRWLWSAMPAASVGMACFLVTLLSWRFASTPTRTLYATQFQPVIDMHFTAVSVCAPRKITIYGIQTLMQSLDLPPNVTAEQMKVAIPQLLGFVYPMTVVDTDLTLLDRVLENSRVLPNEAMSMMSPSCANLLRRCRWKGQDVPCSQLFELSKTFLGYCCSFNYNLENKGYIFQPRSNEFIGPEMGLSFIVDTFIQEYSKQVYHKLDSFTILLHNTDAYAGRFSDQLVLSLHSEVMLGVVPFRLEIGTQASKLKPSERRCLMENEQELKYYNDYSKENCLMECEVSESVKRCGCQPFMYPSDANDTICKPSKIPCLIQHFQDVQTIGWEQRCDCPEQCRQNLSRLEIHSSMLEGYELNMDPFFNQITENQTLLHVFHDKQVATIVRRTISTYWVDLLSSFGGMFNLFLGCSFISLLEVFYFLLVKFPRNILANRARAAEERRAARVQTISVVERIK